MLTNAEKIIKKARDNRYAIPQFNINDSTWVKFVLETCEENRSPVILGVSEGAAKYIGGFNIVFNLVDAAIKDLKITVPVVLHLDHGLSIDACKKAIDAGFTSVMYDGSKLPIDENIKNTKEVIKYAKKHNVSVEAEVGTVGGNEDGVIGGIKYASLDEAVAMSKIGITMLAASLGSVHGFYQGEPKLGFEEMKIFAKATGLPLVLHGGSGIPDDQIIRAISYGETKINVNTEIQFAFSEGMRRYYDEDLYKDPDGHMIKLVTGKYAIPGAKKVVANKIKLFGSINKG